jgi:DNA-binding NarL/FixJ family response regulator
MTAVGPIRILLVDAHKAFIDGLTMIIGSRKGLMEVVATATTREDALALAARVRPDLILLDIDVDGHDGQGGLELLPELVGSSGRKVIILTGNRDSAVHERAVMAGARGILLKTEPATVILKAIEKVNDGEIWLNNDALSRVFERISNRKDEDESDKKERVKINSLTEREREVIRAIVNHDSSTNREISLDMCISDSTLKNHISSIYNKLELKNRVQLLKYAAANNLDK